MILYYYNYFVMVKIADMFCYNSQAKYFLSPVTLWSGVRKFFILEKKTAELSCAEE